MAASWSCSSPLSSAGRPSGRAGGFNENNRISWDGELLVDMARAGCRFAMVDEYWSVFSIYPGSITFSAKHSRLFQTNHARMFQAITRRDYDRTSRVLFRLARVEKWLRNPRVPVDRMIDKFLGAPDCHFHSKNHEDSPYHPFGESRRRRPDRGHPAARKDS
jgi:hypothetical protein